ncbi:MAG TPA: hypothetical protein VHL11_16030, partial [Phototrophicaceae bacterium]|nr:hypothetical protein [Phototrophicaceae bacterium]
TVICENVEPEVVTGAFTHHISPWALLGATQELYGTTPYGILISIVGATFDYGGELSPELKRMLPELVSQTEAIIQTNEVRIQEKSHHA